MGALIEQDVGEIERGQSSGHSINDRDSRGRTIFHFMCKKSIPGFQSCLALGSIDVFAEAKETGKVTCLFYCQDEYRLGKCLEIGADPNAKWVITMSPNYNSPFTFKIYKKQWNQCLQLLSAGANPQSSRIPEVMKGQIQEWIKQIETAKLCLETLFDDEMLEELLMTFVFNEAFLR